MIKIDTNQRKRLIDVCNEFDEYAVGDSILISRVREHKMISVETPEGWKNISMPEQEDNPKIGNTPVYCGVILDIKIDHPTGLVKGDLIRYSPLTAEEIMSSDNSYSFQRIDQYVVRSKSHNVFTADDKMFCEPPPPDVKLN